MKREAPEISASGLKKGFLFTPQILAAYTDKELKELINLVDKELTLSFEELNSSFHKSWKKIQEANIEQLVLEQLLHYFTTYGLHEVNLYNREAVYFPPEKLEKPATTGANLEGLNLIIIKGLTKDELKARLMGLLTSGLALGEQTMADVLAVAQYTGITPEDVSTIKNKEVKAALDA